MLRVNDFLVIYFCTVLGIQALEMKLELETKFVPGGESTCGVLVCREDGVYPRISVLKQMNVFRQRRDSGGKVKVATVSEKQKRVSRLWDGVKVEGSWAKQKAEITMYLVEEMDCRKTEFTCQVTSLDGFGSERISTSSVGSSPQVLQEHETRDVLMPQRDEPVSRTSALQLSSIIQQVHSSLEASIRQLQGRMDDNSRMLENRLEDKLNSWSYAVGRPWKVADTTKPTLADCSDKSSLDQINQSLNNSSKLLHSLEESVAELRSGVKLINGSNHLLRNDMNSLKSFFGDTAQNIQQDSKNVSEVIRDTLIDAVESSKTAILGKLQSTGSSEPSALTSCERNELGTPSLTSYRVVFPTDHGSPFLCDTATEGGGWVVIQRRERGSVDFYQNWESYKTGFGSLDGDFWLGNEKIHNLTGRQPHELMITLKYRGVVKFARYATFAIGDEASSYKLTLGRYSGTAGDSLQFHKDMAFSTHDRDNDLHSSSNCAVEHHGAWWYRSCQSSNLNGRWGDVKIGPRWASFSGSQPVTLSEMKIRPLPS